MCCAKKSGTHKEHTPSTSAMNVDSSPEYCLKAEKDTSKWKYTCLENDVWCNEAFFLKLMPKL